MPRTVTFLFGMIFWLSPGLSNATSSSFSSIQDAINEASEFRIENPGVDINYLDETSIEYLNLLFEINNRMNKIWVAGGENRQKLIKLLEDIWVGSKYDNSIEATHPIVRTMVAHILAQAKKHCLLAIDVEPLRAYVLKHTENKSNLIRSSALKALGSVGDNRDIAALSNVVLSEKEGWAENAVLSLSLLQTNQALAELRSLKAKVKRKSLTEFISRQTKYYGESFVGFAKTC